MPVPKQGADIARSKATYPALFGMPHAHQRVEDLLDEALAALAHFGDKAASLIWLVRYIAARDH